jgi:dTDP-4-dehydrorhamnose reductase
MEGKQRVLVFGASGFLGQKVYAAFRTKADYATFGTYYSSNVVDQSELIFSNSCDFNRVKKLVLELNPKYIVNCVALTDVDYCNFSPSISKSLNLDFPVFLSDLCLAHKIELIHVSTDHFVSKDSMPRVEEVDMHAINVYGQHKLDADIRIAQSNSRALILRTNFFGFSNNSNQSFFDKIFNCYVNKISFIGFTDVFFSPLSIQELVKSIARLIEVEAYGIVNLASDESVSKFDFAKIVEEELLVESGLLMPGLLSSSPSQVPRPNFMSLDNSKFKTLTNCQLPSLRSMIREVLQEKLVG